jgi:nucleotide-binding universal stress UspA family protein
MKVLIAYDGSKYSEAALDDLTHAGLPEKGEALVMSIAEVWLPPPPPSALEIVEMATTAKGPLGLERKYMASAQVVKDSRDMAAKAAARFQANFPKWRVTYESEWGSPSWQLFSKANELKADLIVVGSHGHNALGRLFLGSISQWLLNEARCSVRVARGKIDDPDFPVRLIVGLDGSRHSQLALEQVAGRCWPEKSEVRVVIIDQPLEPALVGEFVPTVRKALQECNEEENARSLKLARKATAYLNEKGLRAEAVVKVGDPKQGLVHYAQEWRADCIFVGATGLTNRFERFLLGSTAGAVAARAHCSVEVVRERRRTPNRNGNRNYN